MNERSRNIAVGLTVAIGVVGLMVMMLLFGYAPAWLRPAYPVQVYLPHADRLAPSSPVRLHGIHVGHVERVEFAQPPDTGVVATVNIRQNIRVPEHVEAVVITPIFGGSTELELEAARASTPDAIRYLPTDGTAHIRGRRGGLLRDLTDDMQALVEPLVQEFDQLTGQFETITAEWTLVAQNVNRLIEPRDPDQVDRGEAAANLHSLIQRTQARVDQMESVLAGLERYLEDEQLHEHLRQTIANAHQFSEQLPGQVDELSRNVNQTLSGLRSRYIALADDLSGALATMNRIAERTDRGEGTLGRLTTDASLYDNLEDTVTRTQKVIDELRLLIEKWKAEGVPVQF